LAIQRGKMKWNIAIFAVLLLFGCKDTVEMEAMEEKLLIENKKYFNSERAAKILYVETSKYFKYGTFLYPRPNSKILRYVHVGNEPPYIMKIVKTRKPLYERKNGEDIFYSQAYIHNNIIDIIYNSNGELVQLYNEKNEKSHFKITNKGLDINATRSYYTGCSFYEHKGSRQCLVREFDEENLIGEGFSQFLEDRVVNKIFKDYAKYYRGNEIIYDSQNRIIKKINYTDKNVKYYFYKKTKKYEVVCNYKYKRCKIEHNCDYKHRAGKGCGLAYSIE